MAGAAIATVISQGVSGAACLLYMVKRYPVLRMSRAERRPDAGCCGRLCAMGVPMGLQYSITAIGSIVLQAAVNGLGTVYVAAVAAGAKLFQLLACPYDAMGATMATYCGQNVGAWKLDRLGAGHPGLRLAGGGGTRCWPSGGCCCSPPPCAMLFLDPAEPELPLLLDLTRRYIVTLTAFFFPLALVNIVRFSIQGMGYSLFAILAGVLEMIARTGVGMWLVPVFGYAAACFASPAAWLAADLFLLPASMLCVSRLRRLHPAERAAAGRPTPRRSGPPGRRAPGHRAETVPFVRPPAGPDKFFLLRRSKSPRPCV